MMTLSVSSSGSSKTVAQQFVHCMSPMMVPLPMVPSVSVAPAEAARIARLRRTRNRNGPDRGLGGMVGALSDVRYAEPVRDLTVGALRCRSVKALGGLDVQALGDPIEVMAEGCLLYTSPSPRD